MSGRMMARRGRQACRRDFQQKIRSRKTGRRRGRLLALAPVRRAQERRQKSRSRVLFSRANRRARVVAERA
jgi:hypothetical protein